MERTIQTCIILLLLTSLAWADKPFIELGTMKPSVRKKVRIWDTQQLPDSTLTTFCQEGLITASVECRGIESRFRIITDTGQTFYAIPDTVVEIVFASNVSNGVTKSIRSIWPQYFEELYTVTTLASEAGANSDAVPQAYKYWADSVQLIPVPIKVDTIYFDCYVEHPLLDNDSQNVRLRGNYNDAALYLTCQKVYESLEMWDAAGRMEAMYEKKKKELLAIYQRKLEILQGKQ